IVVEGRVVAKGYPAAIRLQGISDAIFLIRGEILPGVVAGDGEELPGSALKMLHEDTAGDVLAATGSLRQRFFQLIAMPGCSAKDSNNVDGAYTPCGIVQPHGFGKLRPSGSMDGGIGMP